jgi:hypothetical protein
MIGILNTPVDFQNEDKSGKKKAAAKPTKVANTGLTLYEGGIEKTPTGMSNAFLYRMFQCRKSLGSRLIIS